MLVGDGCYILFLQLQLVVRIEEEIACSPLTFHFFLLVLLLSTFKTNYTQKELDFDPTPTLIALTTNEQVYKDTMTDAMRLAGVILCVKDTFYGDAMW